MLYNIYMNIGLLEDDRTISYGIKRFLVQEGYDVITYFTLNEAKASKKKMDLYLVDITLPDSSGFDFVEYIRKNSSTPVIYISAKDDEHSILKGFDLGGDDYITKQFSLHELKRRIGAIKKRINSSVLEVGNLKINLESAIVSYCDEIISLSVQEYRILIALMRKNNEVLSRESLYEFLGLDDDAYAQNTLNVAMRRLRGKLEDYVIIESVHLKGYKIHAR